MPSSTAPVAWLEPGAQVLEPRPGSASRAELAGGTGASDVDRAPLASATGELIADMAHDLRSPLTSIMFLAETLQRGESGSVTELQRRQLGLIYGAALSVCATATDVLELATGGKHFVLSNPRALDLADLLRTTGDLIRPLAEAKGLEVRVAHDEPTRRIGHQQALARVLLNLASNAVKFTDSGYLELAARSLDATRVEMSVRDTGVGLDADMLPTHPCSHVGSGLPEHFSSIGVGLTICCKLLTAMGSELVVESMPLPEGGTRFSFVVELPVSAGAPARLEESRPIRPGRPSDETPPIALARAG
jgi:signal transduction histidine kinase